MDKLDRDPVLLTPGPLTTAQGTRRAMLRDWGSRDEDFAVMTARVRQRLVEIAGGGELTAVLLPGSGTFAVEAALGTLVPRDGSVLVLVNGVYGERMCRILERMGRRFRALITPEDCPPSCSALEAALASDRAITHVAMVYCETTSGILNPVEEIARVIARHGRRLLLDAMSAFGALPLELGALGCDAVIASSNKCLEGVPGLGLVVVRPQVLAASRGNAHSLSLDLYDQWQSFERTGQWRFTPPTQVVAALDHALEALSAEGGVAARAARYRNNCAVLRRGLRALGFTTLLPDALQAPIIVSVRTPPDPQFDFHVFYCAVKQRGYIIYPGKVRVADTFRVGCIGAIGVPELRGAIDAIQGALRQLGVRLR